MGYKFNRQKPIGNFIVDFYCKNLNLVIEIDGDIHKFQQEYDQNRQAELERMDLIVLRYSNDEVLNEIQKVIAEIRETINQNQP